MASGDNKKTPVTPKQTHRSFKEINNTALGSYTGAKILPFQKGKRNKKCIQSCPAGAYRNIALQRCFLHPGEGTF